MISGLPNIEDDDVPFAAGYTGKPLPLDPPGLDIQDIAVIPGTDFAVIVDEYSPSILVTKYWNGYLHSRNVPIFKALLVIFRMYFRIVVRTAVCEGVVVSTDSSYAIAVVQSPVLGENSTKPTLSFVALTLTSK